MGVEEANGARTVKRVNGIKVTTGSQMSRESNGIKESSDKLRERRRY